jgi:hypothetical protein
LAIRQEKAAPLVDELESWRPVQTFLPQNDAGRDGAFVGRWDGNDPLQGSLRSSANSRRCQTANFPRTRQMTFRK